MTSLGRGVSTTKGGRVSYKQTLGELVPEKGWGCPSCLYSEDCGQESQPQNVTPG